ncbi:SDR family NAD(P)-dependent oxidoreductase, partial [Rhizobium ruizarguesonis]
AGHLIVFSGLQTMLGAHGWSAYAATTAAVRAMTRNMASELAPRGIRVNQVTPGGTKTPIWAPMAQTEDAMSAREARIGGMSPLGRMS